MIQNRKPKIIIGIDPGEETGFAAIQSGAKQFDELITLDFWRAIHRLEIYMAKAKADGAHLVVYVEDPSQNKPTFEKEGVAPEEQKKKNRISQNVGGNKREAQLILKWLENNNVEHYAMRPNKSSMTKLDHFRFKLFTNFKGRTNEHMRDAGMLIYGR